MHHESARRFSLSPGLGLVAGLFVLALAPSVRAGELALEQVLADAPFSISVQGERAPVAAFATENGVYELDTKNGVRVWPRARKSAELTASRLKGFDSSGKGAGFNAPVAFAKKPGENVIAVLDACPTVAGLGRYSRVAFYSFEETVSDGVLSEVSFTLLGEIRNETLANASGVAFFPSGDRVAVSISRHSSGPTAGDEGAVQFYEIPTSADVPVTDSTVAFLCVRTKDVYEGSLSNTGAEPFNVPLTGVFVDPDGERIWTASKSLSAVIRYDPVSAGMYTNQITIRTWEWDMIEGPRWDPDSIVTFDAATADFVQGALGVTNLTSTWADPDQPSITNAPGANLGDLGMAGSTNNLLSAPGSIQLWESPNGNLLVVADTDNDRVVAFDAMGNARFTFNPTDRQASKFSRPQGAWVSEDGSELVVADTGNGRVEIFKLTGADSALDETIDVDFDTPFFWETDTGWFTNWIVATSASPADRTYTVTVDSVPAGCVAVEQETVTLPAGAMRVPFAIRPLDGVADGTVCTLSVSGWETNAVFAISNAPPSVRTGPRTTTGGVDNGSYLYIDEGTVMDVSNLFIPIDQNPGLLLAKPDAAGAVHLHAKAFDVAADDPLTYEWRIIGTTNTLLDPVFKTIPSYVCSYEEGVPPATVTKAFTPEEVADFPEDDAGNKLYLRVYHDTQSPDEDFVVTNVLSYAVQTNLLNQMVQLDWAAFLYDDEQGVDFILSNETLYGADVEFSDIKEGVTYFAVLTVTDKDGGVWRSLSSPDESYVCFALGATPTIVDARYGAVFTDVSETNVVFVVTLDSGDATPDDLAAIQYTTNLVDGVWANLFVFKPGVLMINKMSVNGEPIALETGEDAFMTVSATADSADIRLVYVAPPADGVRFYRIFQIQP